MPKFNHRIIVIGLATVIALLLGITVAPTALADDDQEQEFAMLDDFATEDGASGSGESEVDGDFVEIEVEAEDLLPDHQYELKVTIGFCALGTIRENIMSDCDAPVGPTPTVVSCGPERSDSDGEVEFDCDLDLVELLGAGPATYRLDFFVTHFHPTDPGVGLGVPLSVVLDRDPLLRCAPASLHTVPQDDDDDDDDDDD